MRVIRVAVLAAFVASVAVANWLVNNIGPVPVGFGLMAPAGVYMAGLGFTIRDSLHELGGVRWVIAGILGGAALSLWVSSPSIAVASAVAFGVSETTDLLVYTPLRTRNWPVALILSNVVGSVVDSVLFLWLAFHSLEFLKGQVVGKWEVTAFAVAAVIGFRKRAVGVGEAPVKAVAMSQQEWLQSAAAGGVPVPDSVRERFRDRFSRREG